MLMITDKYSLLADKLAHHIDEIYARLTRLLGDAGTAPADAREMLDAITEESRASLEEMRVSDVDLRQQNEELIQSREILESERHYYQELFNAAPVGYVLTDGAGIILEVNQVASRMLNVAAQHLTGKPLIVF